MALHRYRAYGLEIASEIEIPVFAPGNSGHADVEILVAPIARRPEDAEAMRFRNWIARPGMMVLDVPDVARLRIEDGQRIYVDPAAGRTPAEAVPHLQGSALAALLQQRRQLLSDLGGTAHIHLTLNAKDIDPCLLFLYLYGHTHVAIPPVSG